MAPIYRWPGLEDRVESDTDYNIDIRHKLIFRLVLQLGLANGPQGYSTNGLYYLYPCHGVFGKCEWQDMKKKIGHLPTEFIEITPLNSAEFLYSKGK
jgi:hypothetical protein